MQLRKGPTERDYKWSTPTFRLYAQRGLRPVWKQDMKWHVISRTACSGVVSSSVWSQLEAHR